MPKTWVEVTPTISANGAYVYGEHDGRPGTVHRIRMVFGDGTPNSPWSACGYCTEALDEALADVHREAEEVAYATATVDRSRLMLDAAIANAREHGARVVAIMAAAGISRASVYAALDREGGQRRKPNRSS
jgi:hypothetical protein